MTLWKTLLALSLAPTAASAEEWYRLGMSPNHAYIVYSDGTAATLGADGKAAAWFDTYYNGAHAGPYASESSQDHDEFDCAARSMRVLTSIYYAPGGGIAKTGDAEAAAAPIEAGTVGEAKLIFACDPHHGGLPRAVFTAAAPDPRSAARAAFALLAVGHKPVAKRKPKRTPSSAARP